MIEVEIRLEAVKAAQFAASTEATRYYLNGTCIELTKRHGAIAVATNGHILLAFNCAAEEQCSYEGPDVSLIIPSDVLNGIALQKRGSIKVHAILRQRTAPQKGQDLNACEWEIQYAGKTVGFKMIDGTFPEWRSVLPRHTTAEKPAQANIKYLAAAKKAFDMVSDTTNSLPNILPQGAAGPAWLTVPAVDGFGVLMPLRGWDSFEPPAWTGLQPLSKLEVATRALQSCADDLDGNVRHALKMALLPDSRAAYDELSKSAFNDAVHTLRDLCKTLQPEAASAGEPAEDNEPVNTMYRYAA